MDEITLFTLLQPEAPEFGDTKRDEVLSALLAAAANERAAAAPSVTGVPARFTRRWRRRSAARDLQALPRTRTAPAWLTAFRRRVPRRLAAGAAAVAVLAAVIGVLAALPLAGALHGQGRVPVSSGGARQPGSGPQTTAYLVRHTRRALAPAGRGNLIMRVTSTLPRPAWSEVYALKLPSGRKGNVRQLSSLVIARATSWSYHGQTREQGFTPDGRLAIDLGQAAPPRATGPRRSAIIAVDPQQREWYHPLGLFPTPHFGPLTCRNVGFWLGSGGGRNIAQWTGLISKALSCHLFRAAGYQQIDGVNAARLEGTPRLLREVLGNASHVTRVTLWVSSTTFLPVRLTLSPVLSDGSGSFDFGWLKPTEANLANVQVTIPAGAQEVRLPAGFRLLWAAPDQAWPPR